MARGSVCDVVIKTTSDTIESEVLKYRSLLPGCVTEVVSPSPSGRKCRSGGEQSRILNTLLRRAGNVIKGHDAEIRET